MSLFSGYIEGGGDEVITREDRINLLATTQVDVVSATLNLEASTTLNLGANADGQNINIGTGAVANTVTIGNVTGATAVAVNTGTGSFTVTTTGTGDIVLNSDDTMLLDADGVLELNSSGGIIGIGNDADAQDINIGTGAAARTVTIGNGTGASGVTINAGSGAIALGNAPTFTGAITFGNPLFAAGGITADIASGAISLTTNNGDTTVGRGGTATNDVTISSGT